MKNWTADDIGVVLMIATIPICIIGLIVIRSTGGQFSKEGADNIKELLAMLIASGSTLLGIRLNKNKNTTNA